MSEVGSASQTNRGILARYILVRLLLCSALFSLALVSVLDRPWTLLTTRTLFYLAAWAYLFMGVSASFLKAFGGRRWFLWIQLIFDAGMVTGLVYLTGLNTSPFFVLYFMNILAAAWLLPQTGVIVVSIIDAMSFSAFLAPRLLEHGLEPQGVSEIIIKVLSMILVGALSSQLSGKLSFTRRKLEENVARTKRIVEEHDRVLSQVPTGVLLCDDAGLVRVANPAVERVLGRCIGQHVPDLLPGRGDRWECVVGEGEDRKFLLCTRAPNPGGGSVVSVEDLTAIRRVEAELAREERMAAVGRLAAGLAHEIRNPLAGLSGAVQLLAEKEPGPLHDIVLREVHRLNDLVEDFLDTSRPLRLDIVPTQPLIVVRDVVAAFGQDPRYQKRVVVKIEDLGCREWVSIDPARLRQVLWNLFLNAAQASSGPCVITVAVEVSADLFTVVVADDGPGISPERLERVFDPFYTTRSGGTGLGLANVHRVVHAHGGDVKVDSAVDTGTRFTLLFPVAPEQRAGVEATNLVV